MIDLEVDVDAATLAGSLWMPTGRAARSLVLMLPGSGPSNRHNDVFFPPIRSHLLERGHAVAAFDKRGVDASTGSLVDTTIEVQATDALVCIDALRSRIGAIPVGVFGHSQGGWVAFELGVLRPDLAFLIANSGPTVGVEAQERFSLFGADPTGQAAVAASVFDEVVEMGRAGASFPDVLRLMDRDGVRDYFEDYLDYPGAESDWPLFATMFQHTPERALGALDVATLVLYGGAERVVPVEACTAELERIANPHIEVVVLEGGDHRLQIGNGGFAPGYFEAIDEFLDSVAPPTP